MDRFYSLNKYLTERFGEKVYKLALEAEGMTCPNRDGTLGTRGCIFCSRGGSGEFAERQTGDVRTQLNAAKKRLAGKVRCNKFIAYYQSYTNTYAPVPYLRKLFLDTIGCEEIVALSIGTRPDCIDGDVLGLLKELNAIKPVFVELGLQTIHDDTARLIRRGYDLRVFDDAVAALRQIGINTVVHLILGLPGESREMMLKSVRYVGNSGIQGVKLQLLHVLSETDLCDIYESGAFSCLGMDEYIDIVCDALEILPENIVIHRLTGDAPKKILVAPLWSADKKTVLNRMNARLCERNIVQGSKYK